MKTFLGTLLVLASFLGCSGDEEGGEPGTTERPRDEEADASDGCSTTGDLGLHIEFDLSALGTSPRGEVLRPQTVTLYDASGDEVEHSSEDLTLPELPEGSYTLVFERLELAPRETMTGEAYGLLEGAVREVEVEPCERTRVRAEYELLPSSGHLWVSSGETVSGFSAEQVEEGGETEAATRLSLRMVNDLRGFAFDRMGNFWAAASPTYGSRLFWLSPDQISGRAEVEPRGVLQASVFEDFAPVSDLLFLDDGSLIVAVRSQDSSFKGFAIWTREQLVEALLEGGEVEVEPAELRELDDFGLRVDMELSPDGALWVAAYDEDKLLRIDDPLRWMGPEVDASFTVVSAGPGSAQQTGPENIAFASNGDGVALFWTSGAVTTLSADDLARDGEHELEVAIDDIWVDQLPEGLVVDGTDRVLLGNHAGDGNGHILGWVPGTMPEPVVISPDIPDATDLVLDPRPR